jgi:hypothetical protein
VSVDERQVDVEQHEVDVVAAEGHEGVGAVDSDGHFVSCGLEHGARQFAIQ